MKTPPLLRCTALFVASSLLCNFTFADDKAAANAGMAEMMKKAAMIGAPGEAHKVLDALVGNWTAKIEFWMSPDAPPAVSNGTAESTWILGGRFVQEKFKGEVMGKPYEGLGITGYDNIKKQYLSVWLDDMHTSIYTSKGEAGEGGKVITFTGRADCPVTDEKDIPMKQVIRIVDADTHIFEMYDSRRGDAKAMQITYTRKK